MNKSMRGLLAGIDHVTRWAIVACMATMIGVVSMQVLLRYGFSASIDWAEEISRLAFVWAVFMAIPHGVRLGAHVGIDVLARRFPKRANHLLQIALRVASAVLTAIVAVQATLAARDNWDQLMPTINLSTGWFYLAVATGCAHAAIHLSAQAWSGEFRDLPATTEDAE